jgi:hypothetical protein
MLSVRYYFVTFGPPLEHPTNRRSYELMYIDPTTGSLVLQFLAAGVLSVLAMVSRVREAVKHFFKLLVPRRGRWAGKP